MAVDLGMFVNGKFIEGANVRRLSVFNPANGELVGTVPVATEAEIDTACATWHAAFLQ